MLCHTYEILLADPHADVPLMDIGLPNYPKTIGTFCIQWLLSTLPRSSVYFGPVT